METIGITPQDTVTDKGEALQQDRFITHLYPFDTLPPLDSHLQPHFDIFEAGRKLAVLPLGVSLGSAAQVPLQNRVAQTMIRIRTMVTRLYPAEVSSSDLDVHRNHLLPGV
ncbi:hypothetical protein FIBSPDRAFT_970137 [Athelia psychrophila]|uniref:Uncharacterized protein n=1 Tax=Athelia psychrophila TaxID=1759441 RepID=A0A167SWT4_9AGAM|nr:hypothetical protein FIBSPDRAFT_970137 [Fibularhizoctonia sp. CBS 109695]